MAVSRVLLVLFVYCEPYSCSASSTVSAGRSWPPMICPGVTVVVSSLAIGDVTQGCVIATASVAYDWDNLAVVMGQ